jgi:hypothetical protein
LNLCLNDQGLGTDATNGIGRNGGTGGIYGSHAVVSGGIGFGIGGST